MVGVKGGFRKGWVSLSTILWWNYFFFTSCVVVHYTLRGFRFICMFHGVLFIYVFLFEIMNLRLRGAS